MNAEVTDVAFQEELFFETLRPPNLAVRARRFAD